MSLERIFSRAASTHCFWYCPKLFPKIYNILLRNICLNNRYIFKYPKRIYIEVTSQIDHKERHCDPRVRKEVSLNALKQKFDSSYRDNSAVKLMKHHDTSFNTLNLHHRYLYVRTCTYNWDDIPGGFMFDVGYLDSHPDEEFDPNIPTILALHGYPGSPSDLLPLLTPAARSGCRVIAPSFPGCGETQGSSGGDNDAFSHAPDVQAQFVMDFLANLGIPRVDVMLCHGSASNVAVILATDVRSTNSLLLVSPQAYMVKPSFIKGWWAYNIASLHELMLFRPLAYCFAWFYRLLNGYTGHALSSVISTCKMRTYSNFEGIRGYVSTLGMTQFPIVIVGAEDSPIADRRFFKTYSDIMESYSTDAPYPKCVELKSGGSAPFVSNLKFFLQEVAALIEYGRSRSSLADNVASDAPPTDEELPAHDKIQQTPSTGEGRTANDKESFVCKEEQTLERHAGETRNGVEKDVLINRLVRR